MSQTPIPISQGAGQSSVAAELVGGTSWQQIEVYGGGGASVMAVNPDGSIKVSVLGGFQSSVSGQVGASIIGTVPVTQSGTNITSISGVVNTYAPTASFVSGVTSIMTQTTSVLVLPAAAGGQRNYVTNLLVTNGSAVSTTVSLVDSGRVIYSGYAAASGGGFALSFPAGLQQPSLTTALYAVSSVQASVIVAASGYTAP